MIITVRTHLRKSVSSPVPNSFLFVEDGRKVFSLEIDEQNLPARLVRLLPAGYAHTTAKQWKPFVTLATAMGLLVAVSTQTSTLPLNKTNGILPSGESL